jgi:hypothetical protein
MKNSASLKRGDLVVARVDFSEEIVAVKKGTLGVVFEEADYYGDDAGPMVRWFNGQACNVYDDTVDLPDEVE